MIGYIIGTLAIVVLVTIIYWAVKESRRNNNFKGTGKEMRLENRK